MKLKNHGGNSTIYTMPASLDRALRVARQAKCAKCSGRGHLKLSPYVACSFCAATGIAAVPFTELGVEGRTQR